MNVDNIFDAAIGRADDSIRSVMGTEAKITSGGLSGSTVFGAFDDPENIGYAAGGVRVEGTNPSLFVKSIDIRELQRLDTLMINGDPFWVDRLGHDDCGSRYIWLGRGSPPGVTRRR